jgi:3-oxoacyl-[acyl-carrier protein] reductase
MNSSIQQTALITGASRGIGRAIAMNLACRGIFVYLNFRSDDTGAGNTLTDIQNQDGQGELLRFDVTRQDQCDDAVAFVIKERGRLDMLVNNAGIREDHLFAMMKKPAWEAVLNTHLNGFYHLTRPVVRLMIKQRFGRIINISSAAGQVGNAGQVNYSTAKAGIIGATRALAKEIASRGITVNAVAPGFIDTDMMAGLDLEKVKKQIPAGRLGHPEEVAAVVGFLCSREAAYVTGQVIGVNGGLI